MQMMAQLSKNRKRILALGVLLMIILAGFMFLIQPYLYLLNSSEDHLDAIRFEHANNIKLLRKKDYYLDNLAIMSDAYNSEDVYLESNKKSLATAEIQSIFKELAERSNAELISSQVTTDEVDTENSVGLNTRLRADIFALQRLIYEIESSSPRLVIKKVSIRRGGRAVFRYKNEESSSQTLDVRLEVFGYINT